MAFRAAGGGAVDAKGKLLVLAAVSVGQAGQRALDLLVETAAARAGASPAGLCRVGAFSSRALRPLCGRAARPGEGIAMACEVYEGPGVVVFLQRAHCAIGQEERFASDVVAWARAQAVSGVIVVGGCDARGLEMDALEALRAGELAAVAARFGAAAGPEWWQGPKEAVSAEEGASLLPAEAAPGLAAAGVRILSPAPAAGAATGSTLRLGAVPATTAAAASAVGGPPSTAGEWRAGDCHERSAVGSAGAAEALDVALALPSVSLAGSTHRILRLCRASDVPALALLRPCFGDADGIPAACALAVTIASLLPESFPIGGDEADAARPLVGPPDAAPVLALPAAWRSSGVRAVVPERGAARGRAGALGRLVVLEDS